LVVTPDLFLNEKLVVDFIDCSCWGTLSVTTPIASSGGDVYSNSGGWDLPLSFHFSFSVLTSEIEGIVVRLNQDSQVCVLSLDVRSHL